jgi:predicted dienelactone hydrolase
MDEGTERFPVLVLSPSGFPPLLLATLAEELASHGHVVVGVNHTYETTVTVFSDGRVVPASPSALAGAFGPQTGAHDEVFRARAGVCVNKTADLKFVADQVRRLDADATSRFGGRLDLSRLGALGHSFGGNAALEWCRTDPRCRAAVNLDGALWTDVGRVGLDRPALQVLAEHHEFSVSPEEAVKLGMAPSTDWFEAEKAITFGGWRTVHARARPGYTIRVTGATHLSFMDVPFLPQQDGAAVASMLAATTIAPQRMWRVTSDAVLAFFAKHLDRVDEVSLLDGPDPAYPELAFGPA